MEKLYKYWWLVGVRGVLTMGFGIAILLSPILTISTLVIIFGLFVLVTGSILAITGFLNRAKGEYSEVHMVMGVLSCVIGIIALIFSTLEPTTFIYLIAIQAFIYGFLEVANVVWSRKDIENPALYTLGGFISLIFGVVILRSFGIGVESIRPLLSFYIISLGTVVLGLAFHLYSIQQANQTIDDLPQSVVSYDKNPAQS